MTSLEEAIKGLKEALNKPGVIIQTPDYVYAIYELGPGRWRQISVTFADKEVDISDVDLRRAILYLIEEVSKSLPNYHGKWRVILSEAELSELEEKLKG